MIAKSKSAEKIENFVERAVEEALRDLPRLDTTFYRAIKYGDKIVIEITIDEIETEFAYTEAEERCKSGNENELERCIREEAEKLIDEYIEEICPEAELHLRYGSTEISARYEVLEYEDDDRLYCVLTIEMPAEYVKHYVERERYFGDGYTMLKNDIVSILTLLS